MMKKGLLEELNEKISRNAFDLINEELCVRYNLKEDQIKIDLSINEVNAELGKQILKDYTHSESTYHLGETMGYTFPMAKRSFNSVNVFFKKDDENES